MTRRRLRLSGRDWNVILAALHVAAMAYERDAAASANRRLAMGFAQQAENARELLARCEEWSGGDGYELAAALETR